VNGGCGAGGGGSGGTIFLEGRGVEVRGWLAANGGGGGGLSPGQDGQLSPAQANNGGGFFGGAGPSGAANGMAPTVGLSFVGFFGAEPGGGGGASTGYIWLRTASDAPNVQGASVISPAPNTDTTLQ
jgi:hypothetical protein